MTLSKAFLMVAASLTVSGVASAEDQPTTTTAEKQSALQTVLPGAYGNVEVRHRVRRTLTDKEKVANDVPALQFRPTLGTTLFDGKVDTSFNWIFQKSADSIVLNKADFYNATQWDLVQGSLGHVGPYAEIYPKTDGGYDSLVGFYGELTPTIKMDAGDIAILAYLEPVGEFMSKNQSADNKVKTVNKTGKESLSLAGDDQDEIEQRDPTLYNYAGASAKFKPAALKGFSVGGGLDFAQTWKPKYETKEVDGDERTDVAGYESTSATVTKLTLGYALTEKLNLAGQLRQNVRGFYAGGIDEAHPDRSGNFGDVRWETRVSLVATLF